MATKYSSIFLSFLLVSSANAQDAPHSQDPQLVSLFPLGARPGTTFQMEVRGRELGRAYAVWFDCGSFEAEVQKVEEIDLDNDGTDRASEKTQIRSHRLVLNVKVDQAAGIGTHTLRVVTPKGVSNPLWLEVHSENVTAENPASTPGEPSQVQTVSFPVLINGRISEKGELDYYGFDVVQGQELFFQVFPGPGSARSPRFALYEPGGSWFDPHRMKRLAPSPPFPPGIYDGYDGKVVLYAPSVTHHFKKSGRYFVQVGVVFGGGGPDYSYQLQIVPAHRSASLEGMKWPAPAHPEYGNWKERQFRRKIESDRLKAVWSRALKVPGKAKAPRVETSGQQSAETLDQAMEIRVPALCEGTVEQPGDVDFFKFHVEPGQRLAFEIETPHAQPPVFNPQLWVMDGGGREVLTNVYKELEGGSGVWTKKIEPKTIYAFEEGGEYYLQIRDLTSRYGAPNFVYRVLIRDLIPHVGEIQVQEDHLNLTRRQAKKLTMIVEQEEGFGGQIAVSLKNLPPGIEALPAMEMEAESPPPFPALHKERFRPERDKLTIMLLAAPDAPLTRMPHFADIGIRPIVDGNPGERVFVGKIPLMVIPQEARAAIETQQESHHQE